MNAYSLKDKNALVTGSAQGIGRSISEKLASHGANIVISDINLEAAQKTAKEIADQYKVKTAAFKCDVSKASDSEELINAAIKEMERIDILVNNAGITKDNLLMRMKEEEWDMVLGINLKGVFNCTKAVMRPMMKERKGRIINIASIIGIVGNVGQANYSASKAGVIALTKTTAKELASRNITCNAVAPGFIDTAMTRAVPEKERERMASMIPLAKLGQPEDVANAVAFFAFDESAYITGQVLVVDGGMVM